jgi:uncharacterized repeat protein (TIGR03803 family)
MKKLNQQGQKSLSSTRRLLLIAVCLATLAACGGDGGGIHPSEKFPLIVNVSGLGRDSVLLTNNGGINNGGDNLLVSANGTYQFSTLFPAGDNYLVEVAFQPDNKLCTVTNGSGLVSAKMPTVNVTCSPIDQTHIIGGMLSGLQTGQLMLWNNETDELEINTNGRFQFLNRIANNSGYKVSIAVQPPGQQCAVTNANGSRVTHDVNNVIVTCGLVQIAFTLGGTVTGLTSSTLKLNYLDINGAVVDTLSVNPNSAPFSHFVFDKEVVFNGYYKVTVAQNPIGQICSVNNATGNNVTENITNVAVNCVSAHDSFTISGTLSGLDSHTQITLNNGGENLPLSSNGPFKFKTPVANGNRYDVTVFGDFPFLQNCLIGDGTGTVKNAPVSNVQVSCFPAPVNVLYSFPRHVDGISDYFPVGLMQTRDGTIYGIATSNKVSPHILNHKTGYIFTMTNGVITTPDDECKTPNSWCFAGAGDFWKQAPVLPTGIMQSKDGNIYGTTFLADTIAENFAFGGAIYKLDTSSKILAQNDYFFPVSSNSGPIADLIQDDEGHFYGITYGNTLVSSEGDGAKHGGSIFKRTSNEKEVVCPDGTKAKVCTLYRFSSDEIKNGYRPNGRLSFIKDELTGDTFLFGITEKGGTHDKGVIYKFDIARLKLDVVSSFNDTETFPHQQLELGELFFYDPYESPYSGLTQATDGNLYGVTKYGGKNKAGRIYRITPTPPHTLTLLYEFEQSNGYPVFELVQLKDGNLYGVTQGEAGSLTNTGSIFRINPNGTSFTILHSFADVAKAGGKRPSTRLVADSDGKSLYGGTQSGGSFNQGTLYKLGRN